MENYPTRTRLARKHDRARVDVKDLRSKEEPTCGYVSFLAWAASNGVNIPLPTTPRILSACVFVGIRYDSGNNVPAWGRWTARH